MELFNFDSYWFGYILSFFMLHLMNFLWTGKIRFTIFLLYALLSFGSWFTVTFTSIPFLIVLVSFIHDHDFTIFSNKKLIDESIKKDKDAEEYIKGFYK